MGISNWRSPYSGRNASGSTPASRKRGHHLRAERLGALAGPRARTRAAPGPATRARTRARRPRAAARPRAGAAARASAAGSVRPQASQSLPSTSAMSQSTRCSGAIPGQRSRRTRVVGVGHQPDISGRAPGVRLGEVAEGRDRLVRRHPADADLETSIEIGERHRASAHETGEVAGDETDELLAESRARSSGRPQPLLGRLLLDERPRDIAAAREPDVAERLRVLDEAREGVGARGVAGDPRVQADRHHARDVVAVVAQAIEVRLRHLVEVLGAREAVARHVARVVDDEAVGHDQVGPSEHARPVRQIVVVAVGVVQEPALLDDELAGVHAHLAAVPADRARAGRPLDREHGAADRLALLVAVHLEVVRPAVAVPGGLVAAAGELGRDLGVALERDGRGEVRDRDPGRVEDAEEPPDARARAVLVVRLDREVALALHHVRELVVAVVRAIAHRERLLGALLDVHDDLDGDPRVILPAHPRRMLAVADELAQRPVDGHVLAHEELGVELSRHRSASLAACDADYGRRADGAYSPSSNQEAQMKVVHCPCGTDVAGETDDDLVANVEAHLASDHPEQAGKYSRDQILSMAHEH